MPSPAMAETQAPLGSLKQRAMSAARGLWLADKLLIFKPSIFYFTLNKYSSVLANKVVCLGKRMT